MVKSQWQRIKADNVEDAQIMLAGYDVSEWTWRWIKEAVTPDDSCNSRHHWLKNTFAAWAHSRERVDWHLTHRTSSKSNNAHAPRQNQQQRGSSGGGGDRRRRQRIYGEVV